MFDYLWNDWGYSVRSLWSWMREVWDSASHTLLNLERQVQCENAIDATVAEGDRPEEKPRPPAGGQISLNDRV